jgi:hypothetical protein
VATRVTTLDTHEAGDTLDQALTKLDEVLRRLNSDRTRLCEATQGHPIRIVLLLADPDAEIRIVVMGDGTVVRVTDQALLGEGFAPQVTIRGTLQDLADVVHGRTSIAMAIQHGSLASHISLSALEAMREVVMHVCDGNTR